MRRAGGGESEAEGSSLRMWAQGAPCRRAGGKWVRCARSHFGGACSAHAVLPHCLNSRTPPQVVGKLLGSATRHGAGCGVQFVKSWEPGSLELDAMA